MTHIDLFSGIGGFAYAARQVWPDYRNLFFCDNNKFCQAVLRKNFGQDSLIYGDIREVTVERVIADTKRDGGGGKRGALETAETEKGGPGNQSTAAAGYSNSTNATDTENIGCGQWSADVGVDLLTGGFPCQPFSSAGKRKGTRDDRFLWPEMLRIIREFKPTWIIGENVAGILSMAESVGKPTMGSQTDLFGNRTHTKIKRGRGILYRIIGELEQIGYSVQVFLIPAAGVGAPHRRDRIWVIGHSQSAGNREQQETYCRENISGKMRAIGTDFADRHAADTDLNGQHRGNGKHEIIPGERGVNALNDTCASWSQPWLEVATRLCRVDDGLPAGVDGNAKGITGGYKVKPGGEWGEYLISKSKHREERLKALGNAIVPQVAIEIMRAIRGIDQ